MSSVATKIQAGLLAAGVCAALFAFTGRAHAQLNLGPEIGVGYRSSSPKLNPGFAVGAHIEYKLIPMLALGPYVLWYDLPPDAENIQSKASFTAIGGRLRFMLPLPGSSFRPYAFLGLGRVGTTYPGQMATQMTLTSAPAATLSNRDGWFLEAPIGLGLAWQAARVLQLSADFALRPGFNFKGDAFKGTNPVDEPKMGFSFLVGIALDF